MKEWKEPSWVSSPPKMERPEAAEKARAFLETEKEREPLTAEPNPEAIYEAEAFYVRLARIAEELEADIDEMTDAQGETPMVKGLMKLHSELEGLRW